MGDRLTKEARSRVMRAIRSRHNKNTEETLASILRQTHIRGWRRHLRLPGTPDFVFPRARLAVFVDGCFWHLCPKCTSLPRTNAVYWRHKLFKNRARDKYLTAELKRRGWRVLRIWEHELLDQRKVLLKVHNAIEQA
jgi:DNA mismatch endonuclease (patch repair protein)